MMQPLIDLSCREFITQLASAAPVPGGGGGVGMGGAMGMALCNMVANLTIGKKKYAGVEEEVKSLLARGEEIQQALLAKVDEDAAVFEPLSKAYGLPKNTEAEKAHKAQVLEMESKKACQVPLEGARLLIEGMKIQRRMADIGSKLVISDVGCGGAMMLAALTAARLNVLINLNTIGDMVFVENARREIDALLKEGQQLAAEIQTAVAERL